MGTLQKLFLFALATALPAQTRATVPPFAASLPGNAAISMPLRWSQGVMQVCIAVDLLPANFAGQQIRGLRLRRPALLGEPPYAAVQRTLTVRACFAPLDPTQLRLTRTLNQPANLQVVAGPAVFSVAATQPATGAQPLGSEFLVIPFPTPLPVTAGNLFLEFETGDLPISVTDQWVDAVWIEGGIDRGYETSIGDGACTLGAAPLHLRWTAAGAPLRGTNAALTLSGAAPGAITFMFVGLSPEARPAGPAFVGFGGSLGAIDPGLSSCQQWAPIDAEFRGLANSQGEYTVSFLIPPGITTATQHVGVQAGYADFGRPGLPLSVSNGTMLILDTARINNRCATIFYPGTATVAPWGIEFGLTPVLVLDL